MIGRQIKTLAELELEARCKRAVVTPKYYSWSYHQPASFVINLQGWILARLFRSGMFVYESKNNPPQKLLTAGK